MSNEQLEITIDTYVHDLMRVLKEKHNKINQLVQENAKVEAELRSRINKLENELSLYFKTLEIYPLKPLSSVDHIEKVPSAEVAAKIKGEIEAKNADKKD